MDQLAEMYDAPVTSQDLRSKYQNLLLVLIFCYWSGLLDLRASLTGCFMLYALSPFAINFSIVEVILAVQDGKYIPKDFTSRVGAPEGIRQQLISALERAPKLLQRQEDRPAPLADIECTEEPVSGPESVEAEEDKILQNEPNTIEEPVDGHASVENDNGLRIEPESIESPTDAHTSHDAETEIMPHTDERITRDPFALDSRTIRSQTDRWGFEEDEDEEAPRIAPRFGAGIVLRRLVKPEVVNELEGLLSRFSVTAKKVEANGMVVTESNQDATVPILRNRRTARNSEAQRLIRFRVVGYRIQRPERSRAYRLRPHGLQVEETRARMLLSLMNQQAGVEADGGMMGLEFEGQVEEQVEGGDSMDVQTSQQAGADSAVVAEGGMIGLEIQEQVIESLERREVVDVSPSQQNADDGDQVMSGAVVGETAGDGDEELVDAGPMEIQQADEVMTDDTTAGSDGDSGFVNGDSMRLEADGPQLEANEAGSPDSTDIEHQCDRAKVNKEELLDRLRREKEAFAHRQTSTDAANSGEMISVSGGALAQLSQQHPAPVSTVETGDAATSMLQGVAQNLESTNSVEALREARLGKRPESRAVPEEVAGPGPQMAEDGDTSDTTPPTMTPTSTPPSSTSPTPPVSPLSGNMASAHDGSPKPASAKREAKKDRKRGSDSLDDSSDEEEASGDAEKVKVGQGDQSTPRPGSPKVSSTRRILLARTVKRRVPTVPDSGTSSAPGPETISPAESSKRVQQKRPEKAEADKDIVSLKDIPAPMTLSDIQIQVMQAQMDTFPHDELPDPDLDWTSEEDEPPSVRGSKGKGDAKGD